MNNEELQRLQASTKNNLRELFNYKFNNVLPHYTGYFISGGVFCRLYHNLPIRDVDLFALSNQKFAATKQMLDANNNLVYLEEYSHPNLAKYDYPAGGYQIDLVNSPRNRERNPIDLLSQFDFTISRVFAIKEATDLMFDIGSIQMSDFSDLANFNLKFTGKLLFGTKKNNTLTRMLKYTKLGYKITEEDYNGIGDAISALLQKAIDQGAINPEEIGGNRYY